MFRFTLPLLLIAMLVGCRGPLSKPLWVNTNANVSVTMPPVQDAGPLREMPVIPGNQAKIAIVDVDGLLLNMDMTGLYSLGENPVSLFREKLDRIAGDPCVCAVVVRINTPGGGVTATDIMWRDLNNFKNRTGLPVVACMMDIGAGGGYYLATAADQIVAHPTSITGGMGVILNLYNLQDLMMQFNVVGIPIRGGDNVDLGTPIEPMTEEQRAILQGIADEFQQRFRNVVERNRPELAATPLDFDGRVFTARQALDRGLIDGIGYLDEAVELAARLGNCPNARAVIFHRPNDNARTPYAITPNVPLQSSLFPMSVPGFDRSQMPTFLYIWQPEPSMTKAGGR